jgi:hypothetical protein
MKFVSRVNSQLKSLRVAVFALAIMSILAAACASTPTLTRTPSTTQTTTIPTQPPISQTTTLTTDSPPATTTPTTTTRSTPSATITSASTTTSASTSTTTTNQTPTTRPTTTQTITQSTTQSTTPTTTSTTTQTTTSVPTTTSQPPQKATLSISAPESAASGSDFVVSLNISQVNSLNSIQFDLSYDKSVIQVAGQEGGSGVTAGLIGGITIPIIGWVFQPNPGTPSGTIRAIGHISGAGGASGTGYAAQVRFHVVGTAAQKTDMSVSNLTLYDSTANTMAAALPAVRSVQVTASQ